MKAYWKDTLIAESDDTIVIEGNHYFPRESVQNELMESSDKTTVCSWKGTAHYFHLNVAGETNEDAAWYYPDPKDEAQQIKDRIAFWKDVRVVE